MAMDGLLTGIDEQGPENGLPVDIAQRFGAGAFGVRHHSDDVPGLVADPCDIPQGAVGVGGFDYFPGFVAVAIKDLPVGFEFVEGLLVGIKTAFAMGDGYFQGLALIAGTPQENVLRDKLLVGIAEEGAWQQV